MRIDRDCRRPTATSSSATAPQVTLARPVLEIVSPFNNAATKSGSMRCGLHRLRISYDVSFGFRYDVILASNNSLSVCKHMFIDTAPSYISWNERLARSHAWRHRTTGAVVVRCSATMCASNFATSAWSCPQISYDVSFGFRYDVISASNK
jgi:hypothetical protein